MKLTTIANKIAAAIPNSEDEIYTVAKSNETYKLIAVFTNNIKTIIKMKDQLSLKKCLKLMEELYKKGDTSTRNAIENIFIFSYDYMLKYNMHDTRLMIKILPKNLKKAYIHQIYRSGL